MFSVMSVRLRGVGSDVAITHNALDLTILRSATTTPNTDLGPVPPSQPQLLPNMFKLVQLGLHCTGTPPLPDVQTRSL